MDIIIAKSNWEISNESTEYFLRKVKDDGFDATEFYLNNSGDWIEEFVYLHDKIAW